MSRFTDQQVATALGKLTVGQPEMTDGEVEVGLDEMVAAGLAEKRGSGPTAKYRLTPAGIEAAEAIIARELN